MWFCPENYKVKSGTPEELNEKMKLIKGDLPDYEAKVSLAKFLHANF